jgi:serine/threonine protein kinase
LRIKTKVGVPPVPAALARPQDSGVRVAGSIPDSSLTVGVSSTLGPEPSHTRPGSGLHRCTLELGLVLQETYQLREVLGRGGMGAVYAAIDLNLNRHVAIKIPSTREAAEMMRQEAQALAAFSHRGLPAVYALDTHENWPFIVMERIYGRTLETAIDEAAATGGLPVDRALHWTLQLIDVVQLLHRANLAHRDLKPDNVMLAPGDRLVLLDLGIVRQERFIGNEQTISGSPHYIAPETIRGNVRTGEAHLVDIYALGITAYEMLTGQRPYDADSPVTVMHMHMSQPVPRVSATRDVPPLLDEIVFEMMSKAPLDRPSSIDQVAEIFRHLKEGRAVSRRSPRRPIQGS